MFCTLLDPFWGLRSWSPPISCSSQELWGTYWPSTIPCWRSGSHRYRGRNKQDRYCKHLSLNAFWECSNHLMKKYIQILVYSACIRRQQLHAVLLLCFRGTNLGIAPQKRGLERGTEPEIIYILLSNSYIFWLPSPRPKLRSRLKS